MLRSERALEDLQAGLELGTSLALHARVGQRDTVVVVVRDRQSRVTEPEQVTTNEQHLVKQRASAGGVGKTMCSDM